MLTCRIDVEVAALRGLEPLTSSQELSPYVQVKMISTTTTPAVGDESSSGTVSAVETRRTRTLRKQKSLHDWNSIDANFSFVIKGDLSQCAVKVEVWSEETFSDDFLGEVKLNAGSELCFGFAKDEWLLLKHARGSPSINLKWRIVDISTTTMMDQQLRPAAMEKNSGIADHILNHGSSNSCTNQSDSNRL